MKQVTKQVAFGINQSGPVRWENNFQYVCAKIFFQDIFGKIISTNFLQLQQAGEPVSQK